MADIGHEKTDDIIDELEKKIRKEYEQANKEVQQKVDNYFARFKVKDAKKQAEVLAGTLSQKDYEEWRYGQMCVGERWKDLKDQLAKDYVNVNNIARSTAEGYAPEVYALNHNFAAYQVQHDAKMDISWTLYNREAVEYLMRDDPQLLPFLGTHSPTAEKLRERMDLLWNRQHVNSAITQGILQGEPISRIAKRLERVTNMNTAAAVRNARTMMTSAENKGRQDAYNRLKERGIDLQEVWMATLDGRTRHSHRALHGTYKDPKSGEYENGLRYPGDPMGEPEEIYNCRCCEIAEVEGVKVGAPNYSPKMGNMSFDEWLKGGSGHPMWMEEIPTQGKITLLDIGRKPERPRKSEYWKPTDDDPYNGYEAWEEARAKYKEELNEWRQKQERFIEEQSNIHSMTQEELREWCAKHNVGIREGTREVDGTALGKITEVDGRVLTSATTRLEKLFEEFPIVQDYYSKYATMYQKDIKFELAFENTADYIAEASHGLTFGGCNRDIKWALDNIVDNNDLVMGDGTLNHIWDHEFGHNVYSAMRNSLVEMDPRYPDTYTPESWDRIHELENDLIRSLKGKNGISEYATTNDDELFAEAFAAWHGGEQTDFANAMGDFLRRHGVIK